MTRDSGFKLKTVNLDLGVRKNFFCVCVVRHWNQLPRELWKAHPWKCSRTVRDDGVLDDPLQGIAMRQSLRSLPSQVIL